MVFFETFLASQIKKNKGKEYSNDEEFPAKPEGNSSSKFFGILFIIIFVVYAISILVLWGRMVLSAFKCSTKQGLASVFVPIHYNLYKFADLISSTCNNNQLLNDTPTVTYTQ